MAVQCAQMLGYSSPVDAKRIFSKIIRKEMKTPISGASQKLVAFLNKPVVCLTSQSQGFHDLPILPVGSYELTYLLSIAVFSDLFQWCRLLRPSQFNVSFPTALPLVRLGRSVGRFSSVHFDFNGM